MFDALYIGATGMRAQQTQVDTVANNVANLNTTGFRRGVVSFEDMTSALTPLGTDPVLQAVRSTLATVRGAGAYAINTLSTTAGPLTQTSQPLDIAINGNGFIEVTRADGTPAYTRAGSLEINSDGQLALADGTPLAGRFVFPTDMTSVQINSDGKVYAVVTGQSAPVEVGQIQLANFANPAALQAIGSNLFVATADSGEARSGVASEQGLGTIQQGWLETSNVQLVEELTSMMVAQRGFELNGRVVQAADQMMAITNSLYRT
jgi:flagellar basal-body rod protein FlgG